MIYDLELTRKVLDAARRFGADVVGVGDPERWKSAPFSRTPLAQMADCKATISIGIHYLDSCIELGGTPDPRYPGPSVSNHIASEHCNYAAYRLCQYIESLGYQALFTPSTGWWNYRENADSPRGFSGDITHYYAAVAAGLGEIGWNNLCLTPEFGPRQRLITVMTNAPLQPSPMYSGEPLCDKCKLCEKHCPAQAFEKESEGMISVNIGGRTFSFPHKNLWRCAMGENFQLDSFMERPEHSDEKVVERLCEEAAYGDPSKRFTWKMGMCLKYCVPKKRRYFDRSFTPSTRRRRDTVADVSSAGIRNALTCMEDFARSIGVDKLICASLDTINELHIDARILPTVQSAVIIWQDCVPGAESSTLRTAQRNALWIARKLEIDLGFDTLVESGLDPSPIMEYFKIKGGKLHLMLTSLPVVDGVIDTSSYPELGDIRNTLKTIADREGAPLFGVTSVSRLNEVADQMDLLHQDEDYFISKEQGWGLRASRPIEMKGKPKNPIIVDIKRISKRASDYLENAKSVIVIGIPALRGSIKNVITPPAMKAVHYAVTMHKELVLQSEAIANRMALVLMKYGYRAAVTMNLDRLEPVSYAWQLPSLPANHIAAVCAGIGDLGKNRLAITEEYAGHVRFAAIVTDAFIEPDTLKHLDHLLCDHCDRCIRGCPARALSGEMVNLHIEGEVYHYSVVNQLRCDWAAQYGLLGDEGPRYLGSVTDIPVPDVITRENLKQAVIDSDRLQISNFAPIVEHCALDCPYVHVRNSK